MTDFEFIRSYQEGNFFSGQVIVNCDMLENGVIDPNPSTNEEVNITGLIIPVTSDITKNNISLSELEGILENATNVSFNIKVDSGTYGVKLEIAQKRRIYTSNNNTLAYFIKGTGFILDGATYQDLGTYNTTKGFTEIQSSELVFTPVITDLQFTSNDYNVIINNATNLRKSNQRYLAPTSGSTLTSFSELQDSLYSDTGWSNARYKGSKTGDIRVIYAYGTGSIISERNNYGRIPATLAGRTFQAEYFPTGSTTASIFDIANRTAVLTEYIHDGSTILPTTGSGDINVYKIVEGNRPRKLEESFLYISETSTILETNNEGEVINFITASSA